MRHKLSSVATILLVVLLLSGTVSAQPLADKAGAQEPGAARVTAEAQSYSLPRIYILRLEDPPLASYRGGVAGLEATNPRAIGQTELDVTSAPSVAYRQHLAQVQDEVIAAMEARLGREVEVVFRYDVAFNGLAARLTLEEAQTLTSLPGVAAVQPDFRRYPTTDAGPAWIGAPGLWDGSATGGLPGTKGEGVVAGIIDTGINFDHPSFADVGPVDGYNHTNPLGAGNYVGWCNPANPNYNAAVHKCNDKLIGAWDFTLDGNLGEDDDGHGSHTASTTAGNYVQATINAPTTTLVRNISGVAPHANIIAYDTCISGAGCAGSALIAAINQAVTDGVDVINFSIGGGASDPWGDADSLAFLAARDAGIFVSTSAGNDGPAPSTVSSPANAPWLMTNGASTHDRDLVNSLINMSGGGTPPANMQGVSITGGYGPAPIVHAAGAGDALCLSPFAAGTWTQGQIVVCDRGINARVEKADNVRAGGAGGFVLANTETDSEGLSGDAYSLPGVHLGYINSQVLRTWLASGTGHTATIAGTTVDINPANGDVMADFSSRGPNPMLNGVVKPDVAAPGVSIIAASKNGVEFQSMGGTSMASPHGAGSAALLKALHPNWTPAEIQSALMTTASHANLLKEDAATAADPFDFGAGRIDLIHASRASLLLDETRADYEAANPALGGNPRQLNLASMANEDCVGTCFWNRTVKNALAGTATWTASIVGVPPGLAITVVPGTFSLNAGASRLLKVTANVTEFNATRDGVGGWGFAWLELATAGQPVQRLPIAVKKNLASDPLLLTKTVSLPEAQVGQTLMYTITLSNRDNVTNTYNLVDTLPQGLEYVAGSATGGLTYNPGTRQLTWTGPVGPGAIDYTVTPVTHIPYVNLSTLGFPGNCATYFPTDCDDKAVAWGLGAERYTFYGDTLDEADQSSNGLFFGPEGWLGQACSACPQYMPQPAELNQVIGGLWRDGRPGKGGGGEFYGGILTGLLANPADKVFYGNWHDVQQYGASSITARHAIAVVLNGQSEPAGRIYYIYDNITGNLVTNGFAVGVEDKYGSRGTTWGFAPCVGGACIDHAAFGVQPSNGTTLRFDPVVSGTNWQKTFTYRAQVTARTQSLLANDVQVTSNSADPAAQSMWARAEVTVDAPELYLSKFAVPGIQQAGGAVTYVLYFGNRGTVDALGATLVDTLPAGVTYAWSDPAGSYDAGQHQVTWAGLSLPAGSSLSATVAVTINAGTATGTLLTNSASLALTGLDPVVAQASHLVGDAAHQTYLPLVHKNH